MHRVEIHALKKAGKKIPDVSGLHREVANQQLVDQVLPYIPPKFNVRSTLRRAIEAGDNQLDFDLHP